MEQELNYIGEQILELETERTYLENESRKMEQSKLRYDMTERIEKLSTEIELLENIMNYITQHELS